MSMTCLFCRHPKHAEGDRRLVSGEPAREIAQRLGLSRDVVYRHRKHIAGKLAKVREGRDLASAESLSADLDRLARNVARLSKKAEEDGDWRAAVAAEGELRRQVELRAKLGGQLRDAGQTAAGPTTTNYVIVFEGGLPRSKPAEIEGIVDTEVVR